MMNERWIGLLPCCRPQIRICGYRQIGVSQKVVKIPTPLEAISAHRARCKRGSYVTNETRLNQDDYHHIEKRVNGGIYDGKPVTFSGSKCEFRKASAAVQHILSV